MYLHLVYHYHIQSFLLDSGLMGEIDVSLLETEAEVFTPKLVSTKPTRGYGPLSVHHRREPSGASLGGSFFLEAPMKYHHPFGQPPAWAAGGHDLGAVECSSATLASILDLRLGEERRTDKFATQPVRETYVWGGPNLTIKVGPEFGSRPS
ncbi:hypothetical protein PHYBLDRAFT_141513 [Phycomyces blakesleeanus NRRL 1555(-)]|uniref:Uncharacterized protein n=1 Tax=Phycomyces blakesleeanus (strain ATCC 8743b / DSM 1359 / FGSC 10004 / NBRC 33097 / NRRL 1555) TaxID=763407 RepID=A0A162USG0_PHYB8|nr:hypothetical protein PHYBLDRAFT_141460 [Phycomyces blakesleeanus NRRL 1555(-)]XP_018295683.1 hypothetical protein PHYBLDRAFT_141513 [Phycomyces blakesleeanus NRRL 1555(-)]OAD77583.1 hypothetical protein PHYBLDRAFT_141460 [Phycomyces blakesleeanus NRRL 1555(-)]OAD77643.1 hypothetical protein PHYBLDRAFT_141513 [Phycomyces blakesleeanus NRRL 1555(-)]|eukprot:XP_018295623.1 hypothetical protein PHYBLDRAFT_141460 [Phycomyces blakesleeanus NRRL 1555(-)]